MSFRPAALALTLLALLGGAAGAQDTTCEPGDQEVRELGFVGNTAFSDRELALRIATTASSWTRRYVGEVGARRCLDHQLLATDVLRLRVLYRRRGYFETQVDTGITPLEPGVVRVRFLIREGEPVRIDSFTVAGLDSLPADVRREVSGAITFRVGDVFDTDRLEATLDSVRLRLANNGYPRGDVVRSYSVRSAERRASLELTVLPGARAHIGAVNVASEPVPGRRQQVPDAVVRRLAGLRAGELYRLRDLVAAQRALYQAGLFRFVEVRAAPESEQPAGDSLLAIRIAVREDLTKQVDADFGWGTLDCFRTRVQYTDRNFLRGAQRLELTGQMSKIGYGRPTSFARGLCYDRWLRNDRAFGDTVSYYTAATWRQPALFGTRFTPAFSLYSERRAEYLAYVRSIFLGGEVSATRELRAGVPLRLGYSLEYGRTFAQPAVLCAVFRRCQPDEQDQLVRRDRHLAVVSAAIARTRIDNPLAPRRGSAARVELRSSLAAWGSTADWQFNRGWFDGITYRPFAGGVLSGRLRLGAVVGQRLQDLPEFIPPEERLYAGGALSVRGFQQNELGSLVYIARSYTPTTIEGDTYYWAPDSVAPLRVVPTGGNTLLVANLEYRFRTPLLPELVEWALFTDAGQVWNRGAGTAPVLGPAIDTDVRRFASRGILFTPGAGVRVYSPVGVIQVNVAYNPYSRPPGPMYYDAEVDPVTGRAPLYCVAPGNRIAVNRLGDAGYVIPACPATYTPPGAGSFWRRLNLTFSIGPEF
ncbi:MAG: BamA/OMP85 family outer membrane protein [Gemmatimonadaceae bacterium]